MAYVIGVDCGTSGTKTVLFDEKGTVISSVTHSCIFLKRMCYHVLESFLLYQL